MSKTPRDRYQEMLLEKIDERIQQLERKVARIEQFLNDVEERRLLIAREVNGEARH